MVYRRDPHVKGMYVSNIKTCENIKCDVKYEA